MKHLTELLLLGIIAGLIVITANPGCTLSRVQEETFSEHSIPWNELNSKPPLKVWVGPGIDRDNVTAAFDKLSGAAGCALLELVDDGQDADITIERGNYVAPKKYGGFIPAYSCDRVVGRIFVNQSVNHTGSVEFVVVWHELGHALGLAHDRYHETSIMHPEAVGMDPFVLRVRDKDAAALREEFCK